MDGTYPKFDAKAFLVTLPELPGVYRMIGSDDQVLYVGKAKSLKKRVSSYFQKTLSSPRIALMVSQIARIETTVVRSEAEALLLENNLIKRLSPRYNIVFRDDKSYPYILLTRHSAPRLAFFRGSPDKHGDYFGPYPSASAVRASLDLIQKMFRLRTCEDSVFAHRTRACLLHQIRRCTGPCVGHVSPAQYAADVDMARLFLGGKGHEVIRALAQRMDEAASRLAFEEAAGYRDQIQLLSRLRDRQFVTGVASEDCDIVVAIRHEGVLCLNLAMVRNGEHLGDKAFFPANSEGWDEAEALETFIRQHYAQHPAPARIIVNATLARPVLTTLLEELHALERTTGSIGVARGEQQRTWVEMAEKNARLGILARQTRLQSQAFRLDALREALQLDDAPERIECFDISHTQGEAAVASCVVCVDGAMRRSDYRRFNIQDITPGDDYAAIRQAVFRRYKSVAEGEGTRPSLIMIDGGAQQVKMAVEALAELGVSDLPLIGIAKGEGRKAGLEKIIFPDGEREPLQLPPEHAGFLLLQEIRDEAHRFAVAGHRAKRAKPRQTSMLEGVPGIGPSRRKALIAQFGSMAGVKEATLEQLAGVPGISRALAEIIHRALH